MALGVISTAFIIPFLLLSPIAGVLVDRHNRKLMMMLSDMVAIIGTSPGSGMALQFALAGILYVALVVCVYLFVPSIRNLEDLLPDHDRWRLSIRTTRPSGGAGGTVRFSLRLLWHPLRMDPEPERSSHRNRHSEEAVAASAARAPASKARFIQASSPRTPPVSSSSCP